MIAADGHGVSSWRIGCFCNPTRTSNSGAASKVAAGATAVPVASVVRKSKGQRRSSFIKRRTKTKYVPTCPIEGEPVAADEVGYRGLLSVAHYPQSRCVVAPPSNLALDSGTHPMPSVMHGRLAMPLLQFRAFRHHPGAASP